MLRAFFVAHPGADRSMSSQPTSPEAYPTLEIHPRKLTCPLKKDCFSGEYIFQPLIFRVHVSFRRSKAWFHNKALRKTNGNTGHANKHVFFFFFHTQNTPTGEMSKTKKTWMGWKLEDVNPGSFEMVPFLLETFVRFSLVFSPAVLPWKLAPKMADQDLGLGEIWGPGSFLGRVVGKISHPQFLSLVFFPVHITG